MRLSEFIKHHSLHDSPINGLHSFPEQSKLILEVDICDDGQWPLLSDHPDPVPVAFVFTGVSSYTISTAALDFAKDEISNERLLPSKTPGKEIIEFVILTTSHQGTEDVKFLQIEAENVEWTLP